jgi:hypothetical protein
MIDISRRSCHGGLGCPQFEYIWNWEIDTRFTGHYYEFADTVANFGLRQRSGHRRMIDISRRSCHGGLGCRIVHCVPRFLDVAVATTGKEFEREGPIPPVPVASQDPYEWGVGEEADLMVFLPSLVVVAMVAWDVESFTAFPDSSTWLSQPEVRNRVTTMNLPTRLRTSGCDSHVEESGNAVNDSTSQAWGFRRANCCTESHCE